MNTQINYDPRTMEPIITVAPEEEQPLFKHRQKMKDREGVSKVQIDEKKPLNLVKVDEKKPLNLVKEATCDGKVSIIILAWNQLKYTKLCIESIRKYTRFDRYDLIVVDQGSNDETLAYLKEAMDGDRDVVLRNNKNKGFSGGNNQALKIAEGEYILMINNDCEMLNNKWLDMLIRNSNNGTGLAGALCMEVKPDQVLAQFRYIGPGKESRKWSYIEGWCLFGKRQLFLDLDGFDMRFNPAYAEDADLSFRVKGMGLKIKAVARLPIKHHGSKSKGQLDAVFSGAGERSNRRLFSKWVLGMDEVTEVDETRRANKEEVVKNKKQPKLKSILKRKPTILMRRRGAHGDVLLTTPILKELKKKYPDSFLVYQTDCPDMLKNNVYVDRVERWGLKNNGYDIVLDPRYEDDMSKNAINTMAKQCGVELTERKLDIFLTPDDIRWAKIKLDMSKQYIAIHTGKTWRSRAWDEGRFKEVGLYFQSKGFDVVELGTRQTAYMGIGNDCRGCSIKQTAALIKECDFFIGIDSVCAHLGKSVGTPVCVVYGSVDPVTTKSDGIEYPVWLDDLECRGCRGRTSAEFVECRFPEVYCLTGITVERVMGVIESNI